MEAFSFFFLLQQRRSTGEREIPRDTEKRRMTNVNHEKVHTGLVTLGPGNGTRNKNALSPLVRWGLYARVCHMNNTPRDGIAPRSTVSHVCNEISFSMYDANLEFLSASLLLFFFFFSSHSRAAPVCLFFPPPKKSLFCCRLVCARPMPVSDATRVPALKRFWKAVVPVFFAGGFACL